LPIRRRNGTRCTVPNRPSHLRDASPIVLALDRLWASRCSRPRVARYTGKLSCPAALGGHLQSNGFLSLPVGTPTVFARPSRPPRPPPRDPPVYTRVAPYLQPAGSRGELSIFATSPHLPRADEPESLGHANAATECRGLKEKTSAGIHSFRNGFLPSDCGLLVVSRENPRAPISICSGAVREEMHPNRLPGFSRRPGGITALVPEVQARSHTRPTKPAAAVFSRPAGAGPSGK